MIKILFRLLLAHALTDFALQTDLMCKGKNRNRKPDYIPHGQKFVACWPYWLTAHALISGGGVYWATASLSLAIAETLFHWLLDFAKCENVTNPDQDQLAHIVCRLVYWGLS